jgi:hypothetical protein
MLAQLLALRIPELKMPVKCLILMQLVRKSGFPGGCSGEADLRNAA